MSHKRLEPAGVTWVIAADFAFIDTSQSQSMCSKICSSYKDITEKSFLGMEELCLE